MSPRKAATAAAADDNSRQTPPAAKEERPHLRVVPQPRGGPVQKVGDLLGVNPKTGAPRVVAYVGPGEIAVNASVTTQHDPTELADAEEREWWEELARRRAANRALAYTKSVPAKYENASYGMLKPEQDPKGKISRWLESGPTGLVLSGPSRTGKTTAAYAITNHAHELQQWVVAVNAQQLSRLGKPGGEPVAFEHAARCDLLLLDDLGAERATDWWLEYLYGVLEERCANSRRTIITSNLGVSGHEAEVGDRTGKAREKDRNLNAYTEMVKRYGDRVVERWLDGAGIVVFDGPPHRNIITDW